MNVPSTPSSLTAASKVARPTAESEIDRQLVAKFLAGDESAFIEIMTRHRQRVHSAALSVTRNQNDAEEITQDTFMRAYRGLANFRGDSSVATWLHHIAINLGRNRYWYNFRRRRHAMVSLDQSMGEDGGFTLADKINSATADPAQETVRSEFKELVDRCMALLAAPHREILELCNNQHLSYEDIGKATGISIGTVKSRIARARRNLRLLINAQCPGLDQAAVPLDYFLSGLGGQHEALAA